MPRAVNNVAAKRRKKKILKAAKGYRGARSKLYRTAVQAVEKAWLYSYRDRKVRRREFRKLWITRINAAARINGLSYSRFINGLHKLDIKVDRKVLAYLAFHDMDAFSQICAMVNGEKAPLPAKEIARAEEAVKETAVEEPVVEEKAVEEATVEEEKEAEKSEEQKK
ncbi:MAG: 50S ribosomal protein L20 [Candidatus Cloacimonetes bacterium]|nr:50S ribosomal protein L20 [Candidatus Cloacimonadota bacterium]